VKIDWRVERATRKAFSGAVAGEKERFDAAVAAINLADESFSSEVLDLGIAVDSATLLSIHHGVSPDDAKLRTLSHEFAENQRWSGIDEKTALAYLKALADSQHPLQVLPIETATPAAFAIGGWLLSAFIPDEVEWTDFLDGILSRLQASPGE
jgi:hypothetical protein